LLQFKRSGMQRMLTPRFLLLLVTILIAGASLAQTPDTIPTSIDPALLELIQSRTSREYTIAGIEITGTKRYDQQLLLSIIGMNVGSKVVIPGGDDFAKAINKLWSQHLFSDIEIYYTKVEGDRIWIEIAVTERPALSNFYFKGVRKSEQDELKQKPAWCACAW